MSQCKPPNKQTMHTSDNWYRISMPFIILGFSPGLYTRMVQGKSSQSLGPCSHELSATRESKCLSSFWRLLGFQNVLYSKTEPKV
jgi:hypothetical protein